MEGRVENLKPWPKGVSGNLAGRPKNDISVEIARAVFENNPEAIYQGLVRRLKKGDARMFKVLADRAYGKVKEQQEFGVNADLREMSETELVTRITELEVQLGFRSYSPIDLECLSDDELRALEAINSKIDAAAKDRLARSALLLPASGQ